MTYLLLAIASLSLLGGKQQHQTYRLASGGRAYFERSGYIVSGNIVLD
jgi:hypothetical protein